MVSKIFLTHVKLFYFLCQKQSLISSYPACQAFQRERKGKSRAREKAGGEGGGGVNNVPQFPLLAFSRTQIHPSSFNACYAG